MTPEEQLDLWIEGKSVHNFDRCRPDGECLPDFSCCNKNVNTPIEIRKKFKASNDEVRFGMLGMFLSGAIQGEFSDYDNRDIYISGDGEINSDTKK